MSETDRLRLSQQKELAIQHDQMRLSHYTLLGSYFVLPKPSISGSILTHVAGRSSAGGGGSGGAGGHNSNPLSRSRKDNTLQVRPSFEISPTSVYLLTDVEDGMF